MKRFLLLLALLPGMAACASTDSPRSPARTSTTFISTEEIRASNASNAYEFIEANRPGWLRKHGTVSFRMDGEILVYVDDVRLGGLDSLRTLLLSGIESFRFLDATAASARYGLSHPHGAIQIVSRR